MSNAGFASVPTEENINFAQLQNIAVSVLKPLNFELFSPFGNRHGSWEVSFSKDAGGLHRFISLDLTPTSLPGHQPQIFDVEVWIGAEQDVHYVRRVKRRLTASEEDLNKHSIDTQLQDALIAAAADCSRLTLADLNQTYSQSLLRRSQGKAQSS